MMTYKAQLSLSTALKKDTNMNLSALSIAIKAKWEQVPQTFYMFL